MSKETPIVVKTKKELLNDLKKTHVTYKATVRRSDNHYTSFNRTIRGFV